MSSDIGEILLTKMINGFNRGENLLNVPAWNLGLMLFSHWLILGMLVWFEGPYLTLLMPLSVVIGTGYWMNLEKTLGNMWLGLFTFGMLRVYLLTCFGIFAYWITRRLKQFHFTTLGRWCLTVLEPLGYLWCIVAVFALKSRKYQFCFILAITLTIAITLSGKSSTAK